MQRRRVMTRSCRRWPRARRSWRTDWVWRRTPRGTDFRSTGELLQIWLTMEDTHTFTRCDRTSVLRGCSLAPPGLSDPIRAPKQH